MKTKASLVRSKVGAQRDRIEADFQLADWSGTARLATRLEASVLTVTVKIESNVPTMSAGIDFPNIYSTQIFQWHLKLDIPKVGNMVTFRKEKFSI